MRNNFKRLLIKTESITITLQQIDVITKLIKGTGLNPGQGMELQEYSTHQPIVHSPLLI